MADPTPMPDAFQQATLSQLTGVLKIVLTIGGTWLVNHGYGDQGNMTELVGGLAAIITAVVWMIWARRLTGVLKSASNALGDQGAIIAPKALADKLPSNVVSSASEAAEKLPGIAR